MAEEALLFWLLKFVAEIRKRDGSLYPPNSVYQICCGLNSTLKSANRVDIDMFNSPKFTQFRAMVGKNFQLLICLVPPTSQSISTSARTKLFIFFPSLVLLLLFCIDALLYVQVF